MRPPLSERERVAVASGLSSVLLNIARRAMPRECCGVLIGRTDSRGIPVQILAAEEVTNTDTLDGTERFRIDPRDVLRVSRSARERSLDVVGFFHSHPHSCARPSSEDIANASAWPGTLHIILSPANNELRVYETDTDTWYEHQPLPARP